MTSSPAGASALRDLTPSQRRILLLACLSHGTIHIYELATPAILALIQAEFGAGDYAMGKVVMVSTAAFGIGSLPAGLLADRIGVRHLLLTCLWGAALCNIGMALAPSVGWFAVASVLMGLCISIYHPSGTSLISNALPSSGRIFAYHGMVGNLGVSCAAVLAGSLGALLGWRMALASLSLLGFALGVGVLKLPMPTIHELHRKPGHGRWPQFLLLVLAATCMGTVYRGLTTFLPKFMSVSYHGGSALGGAFATLALLVGLGGMFLAGRLSDSGMRRDRVFLLGALAQAPFLAAMGWLGGASLVPLAMGVSFFHFLTQPVANQMVADFTPPRLRGVGFGLYFLTVFGAGSVGSTLAGWVSERFSLALIFPAMALLLIPAAGAMIALRLLPNPPLAGDGLKSSMPQRNS